MSESKPDTVPGLGFKDKEKAMETIKNLEGRDPDYQKLAIKGLIGRAKRVLTLTKDKDKLANINSAMSTFDAWLKNFEKNSLSKENRAYLPLATMQILQPLVTKYKISSDDSRRFLEAYESVKGEYKNLRTASVNDNDNDTENSTWDIVRNKELKEVWKNNIDADMWGDDDDLPTKEHMEMVVWAFSPDATRIKKSLDKLKEKLGKNDEKSGSSNKDGKKSAKKRKNDESATSSSEKSSDEESPSKKSKK